MGLRYIREKINHWLNNYGISNPYYEQPQIDDSGLLTTQFETQTPKIMTPKIEPLRPAKTNPVIVNTLTPVGKTESIEKMHDGLNRLVGQLENINSHLRDQIDQQQVLMRQMNKLPELLDSLPTIAENQTKLTSQLLEQIKNTSQQNEQFMETLEKIPTETAKQTDCLNDINHQLTAAASVDVQMGERFQRFNIVLDKLNQTSMLHADSITQMSSTFASSDRYMKYLIQRQDTRFTWLFIATAAVCFFAIAALVAIIIYLKP